MAGIFRKVGRAVGNVAAGYSRAKDAEPRRDAQRCMLAAMAEDPDASDRLDFVSTKAVTNLRRALAVAALERRKEEKGEGE